MYAWTVNDTDMMKWCIGRGLDGIITDDVEHLLDVRKRWEQGDREVNITPAEWAVITWHGLLLVVFNMVVWWKFGKVVKETSDMEDGLQRKRVDPAPRASR